MLQTILISSRLEPLKIFLETNFFFCLFSINLENVKCQFEMVVHMRACFQKWGSLHDNVVKFQQ
jgi:hypothetical protein